jgi:hypothetical protein
MKGQLLNRGILQIEFGLLEITRRRSAQSTPPAIENS